MTQSTVDPISLLPRFGLSEFRPGQRDVVDSVAAGRDVMCVMPTGGGKSLCYQLPSLARPGVSIVVSPLIALMKDQVDTLQEIGIRARLINSSLSVSQQEDVMAEMAKGDLDLIYVAPERLRNHRFLEAVEKANVTLLAVDEAHCVSEWGHDFRPDYSRLGLFRKRYLGNVQTIALTATATPTVRDDIAALLALETPDVYVTGFARTNLRFSVSQCKSDKEKSDRLSSYLNQTEGAGIIYAATRKKCEEVAEQLSQDVERKIGVYHAGLHPDDRRRVQEDFMGGRLSAIVSTNAFGMGIDKSDIRFVVHYNMPGSLEAYYQEAGRAGRDGLDSQCELLFSYSDRYIQEFFIENRYPSRETVQKVYEFLLSRPEDPIELTLDQVRDAIGTKDGTESIGTCQALLARAGVLKRMDSNANHAMIRIDSKDATLLDYLPREAKLRRKVMLAIEKIVGKRRFDDVYVRPAFLAKQAGVERDQLARTLRELQKLRMFDYVPPFRGRAVHFTNRELSFDKLEIDFAELERRKRAEFEKLEAVISMARTSGCRQRVILDYFGDPNSKDCGTCDRCAPSVAQTAAAQADRERIKGISDEVLGRGLRVVLSGVARMHGRFGKLMVSQMLCGSKNKKLQQWKLHRLSTYGLLSSLKQTDVADVIDLLIEVGYVEQQEVEDRRPTIQLSDEGRRWMKSQDAVPQAIGLTFPQAKRLVQACRSIESGDVQGQASSHGESDGSDVAVEGVLDDELTADLVERLKRFRRKRSAALDIPAYRVLTNATIDRLAQSCPTSLAELEGVSGIGPATIEQFGGDIVDLIAGVVSDADGDTADAVAKVSAETPGPAAESKALRRESGGDSAATSDPGSDQVRETTESDQAACAATSDSDERDVVDDQPTEVAQADAYWTWRLIRDGYSIHDAAEIRRTSSAQVVEELVAAAEQGKSVAEEWLVGFPDAVSRIRDPQTRSGD